MRTRILVAIGFITLLSSSKVYNDVLDKKIDQAVKTTYAIQSYQLQPIEISNALNAETPVELANNNLNKILVSDALIGYVYVGQANSMKSYYDYLVMFDSDLIIKKAKVLIYRETFGAQIGTQRWLKQFIDKSPKDQLLYEKDIIAISGATISATSMTDAVNNVLASMAILIEKEIL